ncbi:MAG: hypothetical protein KAT68_05655 [Bacteroidales bacterium]|nr:hypothetical protein [Bacteroidales bacterium]
MNIKKLFILFSIILFVHTIKAQINTGINGIIVLPVPENKTTVSEISCGAGGVYYLGYTLKERLDINFEYSYLFIYSTIIYQYRISSISSNLKFFLSKKSLRPFLNFGAGYYFKRFDQPFTDKDYKERSFGIKPSIGILSETNRYKNLFINSSISYIRTFNEYPIELFSFNLGFIYYFE